MSDIVWSEWCEAPVDLDYMGQPVERDGKFWRKQIAVTVSSCKTYEQGRADGIRAALAALPAVKMKGFVNSGFDNGYNEGVAAATIAITAILPKDETEERARALVEEFNKDNPQPDNGVRIFGLDTFALWLARTGKIKEG